MMAQATRGLRAKTFSRIRKTKRYFTVAEVGDTRIPLPSFSLAQWVVALVGAAVSVAAFKLGAPWQASLFVFAGSLAVAAAVDRLPLPRRGLWVRFEGYARLLLFWWVQFGTVRQHVRGKL